MLRRRRHRHEPRFTSWPLLASSQRAEPDKDKLAHLPQFCLNVPRWFLKCCQGETSSLRDLKIGPASSPRRKYPSRIDCKWKSRGYKWKSRFIHVVRHRLASFRSWLGQPVLILSLRQQSRSGRSPDLGRGLCFKWCESIVSAPFSMLVSVIVFFLFFADLLPLVFSTSCESCCWSFPPSFVTLPPSGQLEEVCCPSLNFPSSHSFEALLVLLTLNCNSFTALPLLAIPGVRQDECLQVLHPAQKGAGHRPRPQCLFSNGNEGIL